MNEGLMEELTVIITLNWRAKFVEFTGFAKHEHSGNDNKFVKLLDFTMWEVST